MTLDPANPSGVWTTSPGAYVNYIAFVVQDLDPLSGPFQILVNAIAKDPVSSQNPGIGKPFEGCAYIAMVDPSIQDDNPGNNDGCATTVTPGMGLEVAAGCDPNGGYPGLPPGATTSFTFEFGNNGTTPDVIKVIYGGTKHTSVGVQVFEVKTTTDPVQLEYRFGFDPGDVVVIGEEGSPCTIMEVTNEYDGGTGLEHGIAAYEFQGTTTKIPRFNDPAGLPQVYTYPLAKVLNLGPFPVYAEMTVRNGEANRCSALLPYCIIEQELSACS